MDMKYRFVVSFLKEGLVMMITFRILPITPVTNNTCVTIRQKRIMKLYLPLANMRLKISSALRGASPPSAVCTSGLKLEYNR